MRISKTWKKQADWIILVAVVSVGLSAILLVSIFLRADRIEPVSNNVKLNTYDPYDSGIYANKQIDPEYPPPQGTQASYYRDYTLGDFTIWVEKGDIYVDRQPSDQNTVYVTIYNSLNKTVSLTPEQLRSVTIGCVAMDKPYRMTEVKLTNLTFKAYEKKIMTVPLSTSCIYIGTADHKYFWQIY